MRVVEHYASVVASYVWGLPLILLLCGTHVFLTIRLRFIQRHIWTGIRLSIRAQPDAEGDISQFGALMTALAATIGAGNIVGVATAIAAGGPGAVLWLWLAGVFGIATKYAESVLAIRFRVKTRSGGYVGGPMYVLERGLGQRWLGVLFACFTVCAGFGMANLVQSNALISLTQANFPGIPPQTCAVVGGLVLSLGVGMVMLRGIQSIARVSNILVPLMAILYVGMCIISLIHGAERIPATIATIIRTAFTGQAAVGGFIGASMGAAMRYGIARGLFSNEAGLGSAPIAAAAAKTSNPVRQGLVAASGVFWDTIVICALTGLVIVNSGAWESGLQGSALSRQAFSGLGEWSGWCLNVSLALFVFTSMFGWAYYVEKAVEYLIGERAIRTFRWIWCACIFIGAVTSSRLTWDIADIANGLMAVPNLIALVLLHGVVVEETNKHSSVLTIE